MIAKTTNSNRTRVRLDNNKEARLISNMKFFGAVPTKQNDRYTYFNFFATKKETVVNLLDVDIQGGLERLGIH